MEISELKAKIFELLREDLEFRYAIAGLLGLEEVLHRLDKHEEELVKLREDLNKLREDFNKMREDFNRKAEEDSKRFATIEAELAKLREDFNRKVEEDSKRFTAIEAELVRLREDMIAGFKRHDEEMAKLREDMIAGFKRHDEEMAKLREDMIAGFKRHDEILEKHSTELVRLRGSMETTFKRLNERISSLERAMISGLGEMSKFAGMTFEEFVRKFLTGSLRESGEIPEDAELIKAVIDGEEVNIFFEQPLIVGEATGYAESTDEILKLLRKAELVKARYSREPRKILVILSVKRTAAEEIKRIAEEKGVELIIGKIVD
ncbi:MAG: hypothetical protein QXQ28_04795 [Candidatus Nezhaarchaeales archaeon]